MIACAGEVVALAPSEKLGTAASFVVGPLTDLNQIITDAGIGEDALQPYRALGIEIVLV